ncbi:hypothetical protein RIF29_04942 [Crotalaria pallida]|uniref:Uncharacterized protein n=1 Tax=Crotalaria pallida TaxID=3830 RepID=A0AAN9J1I5_CROPI
MCRSTNHNKSTCPMSPQPTQTTNQSQGGEASNTQLIITEPVAAAQPATIQTTQSQPTSQDGEASTQPQPTNVIALSQSQERRKRERPRKNYITLSITSTADLTQG